MNQLKTSSNLATSLVRCKCPRCRRGQMFVNKQAYSKGFMKMHDTCAVCGQAFDLEVGFYYGSSYVSYALTLAISGITCALWWWAFGFSINNNHIFYWLAANTILLMAMQPPLMRWARSGWLALFVRYNRNWRNTKPKPTERMVEAYRNAW